MSARFALQSAAALAALGVALAASINAQAPAPDVGFLGRHCAACHDERQRAGGLVLTELDASNPGPQAATFEAILKRLGDGSMPPPGRPRPEAREARAFVDALESRLERAFEQDPRPGRSVAHRLNRREYTNAVRDLLGLEVDADSLLPADASLDGFDNIGGALSMSPALLDRYLIAARRVSRLAVGDSFIDAAFASATYTAPQDDWQQERMSEALPFGSRGGMVVDHLFPLTGDYVLRLRLRRNILGYVRGLGEPHELDVRIDGQRVASFTLGGDALGEPAPQSFAGLFPGAPRWEAAMLTADDRLQVRVRVTAGPHAIGAAFAEEIHEAEGVQQPALAGLGWSYDESRTAPTGPAGPALESVAIDGPDGAAAVAETPSRARIFACRPRESDAVDACARRILSTLAARAYRRPVSDAEVNVLLAFFAGGNARRGFDEGVRSGIERLLIDPNFLFRVEPDAPGANGPARVSDLALASRLSFFLWSTVPDDELRETAQANRLHEPRVFAAQVAQMRTDARASALVDNFAVQWLGLRRLREQRPDPELFAEFDGGLRRAFEEETLRFVADQIRRDRSILELIGADYTFLNERLARHYGISGVFGSQFRRVTLPAGGPRPGGLLGHGSILTVTSYPTRTSPVLRGRWLLETIFGAPPPPPPPDIPSLPTARDSRNGVLRSVRERTDSHRTNAACASCHRRMDPLGFSLERFDAIGRRRNVDEWGLAIDASAAMPEGAQFADVDGLRAFILAQPDAFARALTTRLLTYALGRSLEPREAAAVRKIVRDAAAGGYRWSALIDGIIASPPFQMRGAQS